MIRKVLGKLEYYNVTCSRVIDRLVSKDDRLWLLGAFQGKYLKDNAYYFYDYISRNYPDIRFVMLMEGVAEREAIAGRYKNISVYHPFSLKGFYNAFKAGVVILIANLSTEIITSFLFSEKKVVVNFWHGIPMKGVCLTDREWPDKHRLYFRTRESDRYDIFTASSRMEQMINGASFGVPISRMPITGVPRNDYLYHYINGNLPGTKIAPFFPGLTFKPKKIVLYAPTKRENGAPRLFPFEDRDVDQIDEFFYQREILLVLRGHFSNFTNEKYGIIDFDEYRRFRAIVTLNVDKVDNVNDILCDVDIMITDYSGIYWDFLLLDRPIMFIPYDIEEYEEMPGLQFNYDLITAGPKISSQREFLGWIEEYGRDPSIDSGKRQFIRDLMYERFDGKGCDAIYSEIQRAIEAKRP